jgi:multiple sugar transport system permease protein
MKIRRTLDALLAGIAILLLALISLLPILWALSTSLKGPREVLAIPPHLIPQSLTLENYLYLFQGDVGILANLRNSGLYTLTAMILTVSFGAMTAYTITRFNFTGKKPLLTLVLATMTIPLMGTLIPAYFYLASLGLLDRWVTLILIYWAHNLPFAIWLLRGFFESVPPDLEKAALVDGYTRFESFYKILLPLSRPGLVTAALFVFLTAWNDYIVAVTMIKNPALKPLPVGIISFLGEHGREWGPLTAGAILAIVPIVVLFIVFRSYFLGGLTSGAVKG